jgi:hypothetical protein
MTCQETAEAKNENTTCCIPSYLFRMVQAVGKWAHSYVDVNAAQSPNE